MSIEAQLAENTAALKSVSELLAKFLSANDHTPAAKALAAQHTPKAEKPVAEAPKAEVAKAEPAPAAPAATPAPSNEDAYLAVKEQLLKLIAAKGSEAGVAVLSQFGVKNGKQLPADKYPAVLEAIATALKAA